ncbi:Protein of unknown function [Gryllus bimaculatus]|nr:Protein of unknown function [Gryllus bimaculatus]
MECAAVQKDCDSDTETVVCLLSDDESEPVKKKLWSRKIGIQRSPPRWTTNDSAARSGARRLSSEVIYVRDSESSSEDDCVILDCASPRKTCHASCLPADFFDRETPPLSPRRTASVSRQPELPSLVGNDGGKSVEVKNVKVKLRRIDELLLDEVAVSSGNEERSALEAISCKSVTETKQTSIDDNLNKHYSAPSMNTATARTPLLTERSPGKRNEMCKSSSHRVKSFSPDKSKKIRITLEIPYSKILEFNNNIQPEFLSLTSPEDFHKPSKTKISQERKDKNPSKGQLTSKDGGENLDIVEIDLTKGDKQKAKNDSCEDRKHAKNSKRHSRHENKYRCEICWLRVPNVTDHIVTQHTHLFT